jgi:UDP-2,4-diacetamido-2,4,6-trideoxy-beta-L-altropyranose hydrolase
MKVLVRADASSAIGTGHVVRMMSLADELRRRGAEVEFVCRAARGDLVGRVRGAGYAVHAIGTPAGGQWSEERDAESTMSIAAVSAPDLIIVDSYELGEQWERSLRPAAQRLLAVDDLGRHHAADILIDHNWRGEGAPDHYSGKVPDHCMRLLGPGYALLQREFADARQRRRPRRRPAERVLVFFGGSDPTNETAKAIAALSRRSLAHLAADVVIGASHPDAEGVRAIAGDDQRFRLHRGLPSLAPLMLEADLALGAAGTAMWERLCLDLPSAVVITADNQSPACIALAEAGYIRFIGSASELTEEDYSVALASPPPAPELLPSLVDGLGSVRCADAIFGGGEDIGSGSLSAGD